ncbi:MAG: TPM domain-containing protein [Promethearchaeota archaeon]
MSSAFSSRTRILLLSMITVLVLLGLATPVRAVPAPSGYMCSDFGHALWSYEEEYLEEYCRNIEAETTVELYVVTTNDLEGLSIERYAYELFNAWGIGKADVNNGLLMLLYITWHSEIDFDCEFRIEVGQGMEGAITDGETEDIVNITVTYFNMGESYIYTGFEEGIFALYEEFKDDPTVRSQLPPLSPLALWVLNNAQLIGFVLGIILAIDFRMMFYLLFSRNPGAFCIPLLIAIGLLVFAWLLDPTLTILVTTLIVGLGGTAAFSGATRVIGGGGRTAGGGFSYRLSRPYKGEIKQWLAAQALR